MSLANSEVLDFHLPRLVTRLLKSAVAGQKTSILLLPAVHVWLISHGSRNWAGLPRDVMVVTQGGLGTYSQLDYSSP